MTPDIMPVAAISKKRKFDTKPSKSAEFINSEVYYRDTLTKYQLHLLMEKLTGRTNHS